MQFETAFFEIVTQSSRVPKSTSRSLNLNSIPKGISSSNWFDYLASYFRKQINAGIWSHFPARKVTGPKNQHSTFGSIFKVPKNKDDRRLSISLPSPKKRLNEDEWTPSCLWGGKFGKRQFKVANEIWVIYGILWAFSSLFPFYWKVMFSIRCRRRTSNVSWAQCVFTKGNWLGPFPEHFRRSTQPSKPWGNLIAAFDWSSALSSGEFLAGCCGGRGVEGDNYLQKR